MLEIPEARMDEIRAEEIYRDTVRKRLEEDGSKESKFWRTLNQPFAIWVLSTIVVGLVGWAYTELRAGWTLREQNLAALEKLENQGAIRVDLALRLFDKAATVEDLLARD
jgi:hypothetical protein